MSELEVRDLTPAIGSEIVVDVETLVSGRRAGEIRALPEKRGVLVFRELNLDDEQQATFTRTLGTLAKQQNQDLLTVSMDKSHRVLPYAADSGRLMRRTVLVGEEPVA